MFVYLPLHPHICHLDEIIMWIKLLQVTEFLVSSLVESGAIGAAGLAEAVEAVDRLGLDPHSLQPIGPRIVAKAWTDPAFKARLLEDATAAVAELGIAASNATAREHFHLI